MTKSMREMNGMMFVGDIVDVEVYEWQWINNFTARDMVLIDRTKLTIPKRKVFKNSGITFPCGSSAVVEYKDQLCQLHHEAKGLYSVVIR